MLSANREDKAHSGGTSTRFQYQWKCLENRRQSEWASWTESVLLTDLVEIVRLTPKLRLLKYHFEDEDTDLLFEEDEDDSDEDDNSVWKFSKNVFKSMLDVLANRENQNCLVVKLPEEVTVSVSYEARDAKKNLLESTVIIRIINISIVVWPN